MNDKQFLDVKHYKTLYRTTGIVKDAGELFQEYELVNDVTGERSRTKVSYGKYVAVIIRMGEDYYKTVELPIEDTSSLVLGEELVFEIMRELKDDRPELHVEATEKDAKEFSRRRIEPAQESGQSGEADRTDHSGETDK